MPARVAVAVIAMPVRVAVEAFAMSVRVVLVIPAAAAFAPQVWGAAGPVLWPWGLACLVVAPVSLVAVVAVVAVGIAKLRPRFIGFGQLKEAELRLQPASLGFEHGADDGCANGPIPARVLTQLRRTASGRDADHPRNW